MIRSYKDLDVWKRSMELVKKIYIITKGFPKDEIYGLTNQMRRCAVSIPSNIAEGKTRHHTNEYIQFLYITMGSCAELETQIIISRELKYITKENQDSLLEEMNHIGRMTRNLIKALQFPSTENQAPRTGFTLVEIMIVVAIFTIMLGAIYTAFGTGRISYHTQETQVSVQQETRKALTRMTKELRQAGSVTISTTLVANDTVTFQIPTGFDVNGNVVWSSQIQYNRGGLNNAQILRTQAGQSEVLANDISTLAFANPGADLVTINITSSKTSMAQTALQSSLTARVRLRN